tara:strand:- start:154 stop:360 length:207 start_codon:yes stop_codon:yes gene_type:complete
MILTFGDNEFTATVEYCGRDMHKVTYNDPSMDEPFTNFVFNDIKENGEKDAVEMAKTFVRQREKKHGK